MGVGAVGLPVKEGETITGDEVNTVAMNEVVAIRDELSPTVGVGAVGLPVKAGDVSVA